MNFNLDYVKNMDEKPTSDSDDILPEYDIDYSKAKPNHFAARVKRNTILLDDDATAYSRGIESASLDGVPPSVLPDANTGESKPDFAGGASIN